MHITQINNTTHTPSVIALIKYLSNLIAQIFDNSIRFISTVPICFFDSVPTYLKQGPFK